MAHLRVALGVQRNAGTEPVQELRSAIRIAATEARERAIHADSLLAQLTALLDEAASDPTPGAVENRGVREWLATACLKAYWYESL